jgi:hypothetical protein
MPGAPRKRLARRLVVLLLNDLVDHGPAHLDELLRRTDLGPAPTRPAIEADAIPIAVRLLKAHPAVVLDGLGRLRYRGSQRPTSEQVLGGER